MAQVSDGSGMVINGERPAGLRGGSGAAKPKRRTRTVARVTLTKAEAASSLGISIDSFERHVQPELRIIRRGRMRLIPVGELERWAADNATLTLDEAIR